MIAFLSDSVLNVVVFWVSVWLIANFVAPCAALNELDGAEFFLSEILS
jgi:hypothetical protein